MKDSECRKILYDRVKSADAKAAFDLLEDGLAKSGIPVNYECQNIVKAVTFREGRWYQFSFIPSQTDLLFYIRRPALNLLKELHEHAVKEHPDRVNVRLSGEHAPNATRETKIRIASPREAARLLNWLVPLVPGLRSGAKI